MLNGKRFTYIHILYQKNCAVNFAKMRTCFCHAGMYLRRHYHHRRRRNIVSKDLAVHIYNAPAKSGDGKITFPQIHGFLHDIRMIDDLLITI